MRAILVAGMSAFVAVVSAPSAGAETTTNQVRSFSETTSVGVHNSYEKATFPYFADALDSGASLLELDLWTNVGGPDWRVSHMNPVVSDSNCVGAQDTSGLRSGLRDQGFRGCLADMRAWHEANPEHPPVMIKLEIKDGFTAVYGRGPADLDA
ncbi:hypothetical protein N806_05320 [Rhodococcus sp. P27]|nr:hypothetical protein N806_05320 [Rhodococcus sp. P27]